MKEEFIKSLYESIIEDNRKIYKNIFDKTIIDKKTNGYWKLSLSFYNELSVENKAILFNIIEQTMIDTVSNVLGIVDGNVTLKNCNIEPKLFLDNNDTDSELQDLFLRYIEDKNN